MHLRLSRQSVLHIVVWLIILIEALVILIYPPSIAKHYPIVGLAALIIVAITAIGLTKTFFNALGIKIFCNLPTLRTSKKTMSIGAKLLYIASLKSKLKPFLPLFGGAIVGGTLLYNFLCTSLQKIGPHDLAALLFGAVLIAYNFIPKKFKWECDFITIFSITLFVLLVIPLTVIRAVTNDPSGGVNTYSTYLLAPPLAAILTIIGIPTQTAIINGYPNIIFKTCSGKELYLGISTECAGIYTFSIFAALFIAYVCVEYTRFNKAIAFLLVIGVVAAYLANLLRMTIISIIGYHYGDTAALWWTHEYAGLIIFVGWLSAFWLALIKYIK